MFDDRLKKLRLARGLSQAQLAAELGLPQKTYCNYERNEREPSSNTLIKIGAYFGVTLDYLLNFQCDNVNTEISISQNNDVSTEEIEHLKKYNMLNELGKQRLDERLDELLELPKYQKGKPLRRISEILGDHAYIAADQGGVVEVKRDPNLPKISELIDKKYLK